MENDPPRLEEALVALQAALTVTESERPPIDRAMTQNYLGNVLHALGKRAAGTVQLEASVNAYRTALEIAAAEGDETVRSMVASKLAQAQAILRARAVGCTNRLADLTTLARRLQRDGKVTEALATAREAVALVRREYDETKNSWALELYAAQLIDLVNYIDNPDEALATLDEADAVFDRLVAEGRGGYDSDVALSANNRSAVLLRLGRHQDAIQAATKAIGLRRILASANWSGNAPALAMNLNNLAAALIEIRRFDDAVAAASESVAIRRKLAEQDREVLNPELARSLVTLAIAYAGLERHVDTASTATDAVKILEELFRDDPARYGPLFYRALSELYWSLYSQEHYAEALAVSLQRVALCRHTFPDDPSFDGYRLIAHRTLADDLARGGALHHANSSAQDAVEIARRIVTRDPERTSVLADALEHLLRYSNDPQERFRLLRELVHIRLRSQENAGAEPTSHLGSQLQELSNQYLDTGQLQPALECILLAIEVFRNVVAKDRTDLNSKVRLASSLGTAGQISVERRDYSSARMRFEEAIIILEADGLERSEETGTILAFLKSDLARIRFLI